MGHGGVGRRGIWTKSVCNIAKGSFGATVEEKGKIVGEVMSRSGSNKGRGLMGRLAHIWAPTRGSYK